MKSILAAGIVILAPQALSSAQAVAPPSCDYGAPHENAPEALSQFAFLIGDYKISLHAWLGEAWSPPQPGVTARWNGWYGLGGMAIYDEWYHPDPAQDPDAPRGVNIRMYDPEAEEWDMMWIATGAHQVQDLRAKMKEGELWMWQVSPERPGFKAKFVIKDADHWARISYTKDENGDWVEQFKLAAARIPCDEAE